MAENERTVSFILKARNDASKSLAEAQAQVDALTKDFDQLRAAVDRYNNADSKGERLNALLPAREAQKRLGATGDAVTAATAKRDTIALALAERDLKLAIEQTTTAQERAAIRANQLRTSRQLLVTAYGAESAQVKSLDQAIVRLTATQDRAVASAKRMGAGMTQALEEIAMNKVGGRNGLRNSAVYNLSYQINDVITGLASGQAPMMILAQQGGQIFQIFQTAEMSVGDFAKGLGNLAGRATRVLGPLVPLGAAIAVIGTGMSRLSAEGGMLDRFGKGLDIISTGSEHSARAMTDAALAMRQFGVGSKEASDFTMAMAANGIRDDKMLALVAAAKSLADVTGMKLPDALSKVQGAFSGGFEALRKFDQQTNLFTAAQLNQIRVLYDGGKAAEAQQLALDLMSGTLGKTTSDAVTLTSAWNNLVDAILATGIPKIANSIMEYLGYSIEGWAIIISAASQSVKDAIDPTDATRLKQITTEVMNLTGALYRAEGRGDMAIGKVLRADIQALLAEEAVIKARVAALPGATPGVTTDQAELQLKLQDDLTASIQAKTIAEMNDIAALQLKGRELARHNAIMAENKIAEDLGIAVQASGLRLTPAQVAAVNARTDAMYDAKEARDALTDAEREAASAIQQQMSAEQKRAAQIDSLTAAVALLTRTYGATSPAAIAAANALAELTRQQNSAAVAADNLTNKALRLRNALSSLGAVRVDLNQRFATAQRELAQIEAGVSQETIDAQRFAIDEIKGEMATLVAGGASADAIAKRYSARLAEAERVFAAEKAVLDARNARDAAADAGGAGGAGGGGAVDQDRLREVNNLYAERKLLIQEIDAAQKAGDTTKVEALRTQLTGLNSEILRNIDSTIAYYQSLSGPAADAAILKLQKIRAEIAGLDNKMRTQFLPTAEEMNNRLAQIGADGLGAFAKALAEGKNTGEAMFAALKQGLAEFVIDIGKAIVKQALFNALTGGGGPGGGIGGSLAGFIGKIFHEGGVVGGVAPSRAVDASVFAGARRFHNGGLPGLKPGEVPAILQNGEEVLTGRDPRHVRNGGGGAPRIKIVNVIDAGDMLNAAVSSEHGEQVMMNFISRRSTAIRGSIGG